MCLYDGDEGYAQSVVFWLEKALKEYKELLKQLHINPKMCRDDFKKLYNIAVKISIAQNSLVKMSEQFELIGGGFGDIPPIDKIPKYAVEDDFVD